MVQLRTFMGQLWGLFASLFMQPDLRNIVDIAVMTFLIYHLLKLISNTRASSVFKGVVFVAIIAVLAEVFQLNMLRWVINAVFSTGVICLVILFQPELRKVLEQLGRTRFARQVFSLNLKPSEKVNETEKNINEIVNAVLTMSKKKIGALILFEGDTGLKDVMETGTYCDASISSALLQNIFEPNTPLHDGATIIRDQRIVSSACFLQLSENSSISRDLGTRHRAAIGITETTDCISLIVSEETGVISYARRGRLTRYLDERSLRELLHEIFDDKDAAPDHISKLLNRFGRKEKADV